MDTAAMRPLEWTDHPAELGAKPGRSAEEDVSE